MYRLVIADDEVWIRERLAKAIDWASAGIEVAGVAQDGKEALRLCLETKPDVVITDIRMPGLSGLEFLKELKNHSTSAKIIIISGYSDFEYAREAIKLGVTDYILKPVEDSEIFNTVKKCVQAVSVNPAKRNSIEKALKFVEGNYQWPIQLQDAAAAAGMNPSYFSKLFKDVMGVTFNHYLTELRVDKAVELMRDTSLKIYEIADRVGYENVQYFIRVFKSRKGVSPFTFKENA
jgi:two-component system response regulator YesN